MSRSIRRVGSLFLAGAAVHLTGLRMIAHWEYPAVAIPNDGSPWLVNHPLTNIGAAFFGGIFVALAMRGSIPREPNKNIDRTRLVLLSGARGVAATWLALQAICVCLAIVLFASGVHWAAVNDPQQHASLGTWISMFGVCLVSVETYGIAEMAQAVPFGLSYGLMLGVFFAWLSRSKLESRRT